MTYFLSEIRGIVAFRSVREVKCGIIVKVAVVQWLKEGENIIELLLGVQGREKALELLLILLDLTPLETVLLCGWADTSHEAY